MLLRLLDSSSIFKVKKSSTYIFSDSFGVRLLKKMGWREGKGIGGKMSRRALERQKGIFADIVEEIIGNF